MHRRRFSWALRALLLFPAGCATSPFPPESGPRVEPDGKEWRRKTVPLPPLYMNFISGSGKHWTMATPLYWQVLGADTSSYNLIPLASFSSDRMANTAEGHVLNYFWGKGPERQYRVGFPFYWSFQRPGSETSIYGPVYRRKEADGERERLVVFPWLFSRETDATGYSYWGILGRLVGYEKQVIDGQEKKRLWLFFVFHVNTA